MRAGKSGADRIHWAGFIEQGFIGRVSLGGDRPSALTRSLFGLRARN